MGASVRNDVDWSSDPEFIESAKPELEPGETLIWAFRPAARPVEGVGKVVWLAVADVAFLALGLASIFPGGRPADSAVGAFLCFFAFFCITLALLKTSSARKRRIDEQESRRYLLTDSRVVVWAPLSEYDSSWRPGAMQVVSHRRGEVAAIHRIEYGENGLGAIVLTPRPGADEFGRSSALASTLGDVPNVRDVERLFRRVLLEEHAVHPTSS